MSDVRWEGLTHEEIYARVQQGPGAAASADAEAAWSTVESTIRAVDEQLTRAVRQIGVDWQGAAADNVRGGMTVMSNWALDAAGDALLTKEGVAAQADAAAHVRAAMPAPRTTEWNEAVGQALSGAGYVPGLTDVGAIEDRMADDRAAAVDLMNRYTSDSSANQRLMNYWTPPPSVVVDSSAPAPTSGASSVAGTVGAVGALAAAGVAGRGAASGSRGTATARRGTAGIESNGATPEPDGAPPGTGLRPDATSGPVLPGAGVTPGVAGVPTDSRVRPEGTTTEPGTARDPATGAAPAGTPGSGAARAGQLPGADRPATGVRPVVPEPPWLSHTSPGSVGAARGSPTGAARLPGRPVRLPGGALADGLVRGGTAEQFPRGGIVEPAPRGGLGGPGGSPGRSAPDAGGAVERAAAGGRGGTASGHGVLPLGGVAARPADREHRRPDYLLDDTDAFADDRRFTPAVIGGDDDPETLHD